MAFIQWQPHTVPGAWSEGIEEVLKTQQTIDYELLNGQNKVEVQVSLIETLVEQGASVISAADRQRGARAVDCQRKACRSQRHHANIDASRSRTQRTSK